MQNMSDIPAAKRKKIQAYKKRSPWGIGQTLRATRSDGQTLRRFIVFGGKKCRSCNMQTLLLHIFIHTFCTIVLFV